MAAGKSAKSKNGRRYSPEERQHHADAFRASGLSQAAYCKKAKVSPITLSSWVKQYPAQRTRRAKDGAGKFQPGAPVDVRDDDFFARVKDEPLTLEQQNQRMRIAIKALARML